MPEPVAEIQATADASLISPSPIHTTASLVVPALQDTVDTIDAMVAAAVASASSQGIPGEQYQQQQPAISENLVDPEMKAAGEMSIDVDDEEINDDDSFGDPYTAEEQTQATRAAPIEQPADSDDYARTFDSPIDSEEDDVMRVEKSEPQEENQTQTSAQEQEYNLSHDPAAALPPKSPTPNSGVEAVPQDQTQDQTNATPTGPAVGLSPTLDAKSLEEAFATVEAEEVNQRARASSADIQQLLADLSAQNSEEDAKPSIPTPNEPAAAPQPSSTVTLPAPASLPPRPPQPNEASSSFPSFPSFPSQHHPSGSHAAATAQIPGQHATFGASGDALNSYTPGASPITHAFPENSLDKHSDDYQRQWNQFIADERQYMSDALWDRFPEGARSVRGNLSSDKVSKKDVFDIFHKFGRLAQISLKSAYGFVQYHTVEEGRRAIDNMEGSEVKGRRIHLEISRLQDKAKKERPRSPDKNRGRDASYRHDRYGNSRDTTRSREHSPRRDSYGRERNYYEGGRSRGRSRSPSYGRNDRDSYRRRSPSPRGRTRHDDLDLPRRYGSAVPDVQLILQPEVSRDFVNWVEAAFKNRALKTEIMYLHPRMPKDQIIQRQAAEGVHAVVDLDLRAQQLGRVPVQAFDRSAGAHNVRYDQYVDLDPPTAAEVILRAKASAAPPAVSAYGQPPAAYGALPTSYPQYGALPQQPQHNSYSIQPLATYPPQAPAGNIGDIGNLLSQVDPSVLQQLLSTMQQAPSQQQQQQPAQGIALGNPQIDLQAILGSLSTNAGMPSAGPPQGQYGQMYPPQGQASNTQVSPGEQAAQVQKIMAQLSKYR